jgi:hypothetical protein
VPVVKAGPDQFLLVGRKGTLENRGSAVQAFLWPGAVHVLVPATKQEARFEFTQETRDGIPLRFKGIVIFRVSDPVAAARQFSFGGGSGLAQVGAMLTHICLGELRHAVSHMTMVECIEQRKTTLTGVAETALRTAIRDGEGGAADWGIALEVAQVAQVFIVDEELRAQLEAEIRNEIQLKSDQSEIRTREETRLAEMASANRMGEQQLAADQEALKREEAIELARMLRERRRQAEEVASERETMRLHAQLEADEDRIASETPVRLLRIARKREVVTQELELRRLQQAITALEVDRNLAEARAVQAMRLEMLPLEQAPELVRAASQVLNGTNLTVYGEDNRLFGQLAPVFDLLASAVGQATQGPRGTPSAE